MTTLSYNLPQTPAHIPLTEIKLKEATGIAFHWNDDGINKLGLFPILQEGQPTKLRFFGGTANPASTIPGFIYSLLWMRDRGFPLPAEAILSYRTLIRHVSHTSELQPGHSVPDYEQHGIVPADSNFAELYGHRIAWLWGGERGQVCCSHPAWEWSNHGIQLFTTTMLGQLDIYDGDLDAITAKQFIYDTDPFR